jgi:hypothetical protein
MKDQLLNNYRCLMEKLQPLLKPEDVSVMKQMELLVTGEKKGHEKPVTGFPGKSKLNHRQRVHRYL